MSVLCRWSREAWKFKTVLGYNEFEASLSQKCKQPTKFEEKSKSGKLLEGDSWKEGREKGRKRKREREREVDRLIDFAKSLLILL